MPSERLQQHYNVKYAHEITGSDRVVAYTTTPFDRFEACLFNLTQNFKRGDILEVGGGDGTVARSVLKHGLPFSRYTVTDLSAIRATSVAESISDRRFEAFQLDIEAGLGALERRRFNAILMIAVIEHLVDPITAMRRIGNLLTDDGFILIDTPHIAKYTRRIKLLIGFHSIRRRGAHNIQRKASRPVRRGTSSLLDIRIPRENACALLRAFRGSIRSVLRADTKLPRRVAHELGHIWPELFSDVSIIARK